MNKQKSIKMLGIGLVILSVIFSSYKYNIDATGNTSFIYVALIGSIIGVFITLIGSKKWS